MAGRRIADRYELIAVLGEGGMGVVWRGRDTRLGRAVAVKVLSSTSVGNSVARARLIREARAAAALEHDGIIRVYDVGETEDGGAFLVMELIRGSSFRDALIKATITPSQIVAVVVEAARALGFAHAAGIVHRDVKPDNIMIREDGRVTLVDFGVAKPVATELLPNGETLAGVSGTNLTGLGQLVGTPAYLAPEQARGLEISPATDQFALAVTLYEALCGKLPWSGSGLIEVVASLLRDPAPRVSASSTVPPELDPVLLRALEKEPQDRWPDMNAFADALVEAARAMPAMPSGRDGRSSGSSPPRETPGDGIPKNEQSPAASSLPAPAASTHSGHSATPEPSTASRSSPGKKLAIAVAAIGIVVTGWLVTHPGAKTPSDGGQAAKLPVTLALACPSFEVTGVDDKWLGTAGAALACERLQIARGGLDAHTMVPAELADAPREVVEGLSPELIDASAARERGIAVAKERAPSWVDGKIEKQLSGYTVSVVLRSAKGAELAKGEGRGVELFEAVRDAVKPIVESGPPLAEAELAHLRDWLDVSSVAGAQALLDVRTAAVIEDPVSLKEACAAVERRTDLAAPVVYLNKAFCARRLRTGKVEGTPPAHDDSTPGRLITTALAQGTEGGPAAVRERAQRLEALRDKTALPEGQSRLAAAAAELYNLIGDPRARQVARMAVQASPKAFDWRTSSWHRLAFSSEGDAQLGAALMSWHPWEPISQTLRVPRGVVTDAGASTKYIYRAYLLSQRGYYANFYGETLINEGKLESARGIAELTKDDLLRVKLILAEARYGEALATVPRIIGELPATEEKAALAFQLATEGTRASQILGRPADYMDVVVSRYVTSEPHHVVDGVVPFISLVSGCCFAPKAVGKKCIERLQQLRADGKLPTIFNTADVVVAGAARYVADDFAGAAKQWRTMLRTPGWIQDPLREAMALAFERAGAPELAEEVDAPSIALVDLPRTADLAWVRGAKRAQQKGDVVRARKLASAVIDKWRFADEDIPAMREMKQLLAKLPP